MITTMEIEDRLASVETDTKEILALLKSNPDFNKKGLVETVQHNDERIRMLELEKKIQKARLGTLAGGVSLVVTVLLFTIQAWINSKIK